MRKGPPMAKALEGPSKTMASPTVIMVTMTIMKENTSQH